MNTDPEQIFREAGRRVAAAISGRDSADYYAARGYQHARERGDMAPVSRALCKLAADVFAHEGALHSIPGLLYLRLADDNLEWSHGYDRYADTVATALAKVASEDHSQESAAFFKAASILPATAVAAHDSLGGNVLKTLLAAGALGGIGAGSLTFLLNRNAEQTSAENAKLLEKAIVYKKLRREIEEDLEAEGLRDIANPKGRFQTA